MAKRSRKKRDNGSDDVDDEAFNKIVDILKELVPNVDLKFILTVAGFIYLWWLAWGKGKTPTKEDVALGLIYAVTVPPALQGGTLANAYGLAVLSALGVGFIPDLGEFFEGFTQGVGQAFDWATSGHMPIVWFPGTLPGTGQHGPSGSTGLPGPSPEEFGAECRNQGGEFIRIDNMVYCVIGNQQTPYTDYYACVSTGGSMDLSTGTCNKLTK